MNLLWVFLMLLGVRLASVFIVQTFYVPDEYWQSLEVAHKLTFGYGYLTWEWVQGIRSYIYPLMIAGIFKVLALLNLDTVQWLVLLPRILQAILSAYSDYRFYIWTGKKKWALFVITIPWFWFYMGSRTLSNTLETSLTTIGLSYFPWYGESMVYLWPAALCCFLRPTAVLIWLPLVFYHMRKSKLSWADLVLKRFLIVGLIVASICIGIDSWMHGGLLITPYEFLKYNVFHNIGSFYGSHPWYWYFTVGLPTVLGINFLPFLFGTVETIRRHKVYTVRKYLLITILLSLLVLSTVEHKEFRFVSVLLPLCLYVAADTLTRWSYKASSITLWLVAGLLVIGNAIPAWYLSTIHQKGPIELMTKLGTVASEYRDEHNRLASILFLMPCHSTPYYSHIHQNVTMRFLTCEPNLKNVPDYKDEADKFYENPVQWLKTYLPSYPRSAKPSHLVLYEPLAEHISTFLEEYKQLHSITNAEYIQSRTGKNILVYQRLKDGEENAFNRKEYQRQDGNMHLPKPYEYHDDLAYGEREINDDHNLFN